MVIFLGMIKVESDLHFPSGDISAKMMMVISATTCMLGILCSYLVLLVVVRKILMLQLEIDQRKVYIPKEQRENCRSGLLELVRKA